jgi:two-component system sensor histidine kinase RpfC
VLWLSPFWSQHVTVGMGFMVALLVLPFYVGVLSQRITEAKRRADEANAAKGRFLANVSHEMRTPLNGVIAMADVLRETNLNEAQHEIVETMTTSGAPAARADRGRARHGQDRGRARRDRGAPFDFGKLGTGTVKVMLPQARYKGLAINTEIDPAAARWFSGDQHHIRQVLLNLLANAVKFTEKGEITLRVKATPAPGGALVRVEVQDTGIGIPESKQNAIFEPFTQADDSVTRVYGAPASARRSRAIS